MDPGERASGSKFLIRDRDSKFTTASGAVFAGTGARVIQTPARSPHGTGRRRAGTRRHDRRR